MSTQRTVSVVLDARGRPRAVAQPAYQLRVVRGPDRRKRARFSSTRVSIGGAGASFPLQDPTVSAVHCEIVADEQGFWVRDLGAKNGVYVDGVRVREAGLRPVEKLTLGESVVEFKLLDEVDERPVGAKSSLEGLRGGSVMMREVYAKLERAAGTDATVLLQGESGTGKRLAAEALVSLGPRRTGPLVVVDCAALPISLAASELLGHEKGAFTGAVQRKAGAFERAHHGTLYLQRVGELPQELQPQLLGVLERREVQPVGGSRTVPVDVRVIASSQVDLQRAVNQGRFRADLYYRLAVVEVRLPSLSEHREDVPALVEHFLEELGSTRGLAPDVLRQLYEREYPGNVRELRNAVERAALGLAGEDPAPLGPGGAWEVSVDEPYHAQKRRLVGWFERTYLLRMLEACGHNLSEVARRSKLNRMYVYELLERLGLGRPGAARS